MALKQKLALQLQQRLVMTPALQMAIRLLQLNRLELENVLQQEMVDNPMLEEREGPEESVDIAVPADEVGIEGQEQGDAEESLPEDVNSFDEINIEAYFQDYYDAQPSTGPVQEHRDQLRLENMLAARPTMEQQLLWQLEMSDTSPLEMEIGRAIIGNVDEEGYLTLDTDELAVLGNWPVALVLSLIHI